ncbi:MAG TPA: tetrathionate reductase family octaheme c-type cytochrome [Gammaproteobacteria bacterium]|nr:tetrathionate reductase family octaheme c-type cytochrome [Gammaproteobacteria bacterium]
MIRFRSPRAGARIRDFGIIVFGLVLNVSSVAAPELPPIDPQASYRTELGISEYKETAAARPVDKSVTRLRERKGPVSTTDHAKLKELQGPFANGPEVTKACLGCHTEAGHQFVKNKHWTWRYDQPVTGKTLGKSVLINNFCTNARGNEGMCAQCHAGYNMTDVRTYDFSNQDNIDCLICHESTGTYYKTPPTRGNQACEVMFTDKPAIDLTKVAQSVTLPGRNNCGTCHFFGGGGDNVKHGDLSSVLFKPSKAIDVHMGEDGENFSCVICHVGEGHEWAGSRYDMVGKDTKGTGKPGMPRDTASCESCHGHAPHPPGLSGFKLNDHTDRVACETCHIPTFARGGVATKVSWDWRTAGRLKDGQGFKLEGYTQGDGKHRHTYKSIKGDFAYAENVKPTYAWFNGAVDYTTIDTKFDDSRPLIINRPRGSADDPDARIWPFKRMHTVQPYDKGNKTLVYMHLWGDDPDAFWGNYDFQRAITRGMAEDNIPYSGEYDFIDTYSYWPINHMVAPKEDALSCRECHSREGRLADLDGFYLPGRDSGIWLDRLGILAVIAALAGVLLHAAIRIVMRARRKS